jgi:PHP family Zn ribbon phosphoesterase
MGALVTAVCNSCQFRSERLTLGPAPYPDKFDPVLTSCRRCKKLVVANLREAKLQCPTCRGRLRKETRQKVPCPLCSKPIDFEMVGLWD